MKKHNYRFIAYALFLVLIIFTVDTKVKTNTTHAAVGAFDAAKTTTYNVLAPLPCIASKGVVCPNGSGNLAPTVDIRGYLQQMYNLLVAISSVAAVFMIVYGGFEYVSSAAVQGKQDGKERIQNALIGLLLVLGSYLILRTVNPEFVNIPVGLVSNLGINIKPETLALLNGEKFQADYEAAKTQTDQATAQKTSLKQQLLEEIASTGTTLDPNMSDEEWAELLSTASSYSPDAAALASQISAAQDSINTGIVNQHIAEAKSLMFVELSSFNQHINSNPGATSVFNAINSEISIIDKIAADQNTLASKYSSASGQSEIAQQAAYTKALLELNGVIVVIQNDSTLNNWAWSHDGINGPAGNNNLDKTATDYVNAAQTMLTNNIVDPTMRNDIQEKINTARALITQKAYKP